MGDLDGIHLADLGLSLRMSDELQTRFFSEFSLNNTGVIQFHMVPELTSPSIRSKKSTQLFSSSISGMLDRPSFLVCAAQNVGNNLQLRGHHPWSFRLFRHFSD